MKTRRQSKRNVNFSKMEERQKETGIKKHKRTSTLLKKKEIRKEIGEKKQQTNEERKVERNWKKNVPRNPPTHTHTYTKLPKQNKRKKERERKKSQIKMTWRRCGENIPTSIIQTGAQMPLSYEVTARRKINKFLEAVATGPRSTTNAEGKAGGGGGMRLHVRLALPLPPSISSTASLLILK